MADDRPPRSASLPPGFDEEDPYEGEDLSTYPAWWRRNVEVFRNHGMRPYRPPRFADGTLVPELLETLESELGVEVKFRTLDPYAGGEWEVLVDGEHAGTAPRHRDGAGYTRYELPAAEFETLVREAAAGNQSDDPGGQNGER